VLSAVALSISTFYCGSLLGLYPLPDEDVKFLNSSLHVVKELRKVYPLPDEDVKFLNSSLHVTVIV
jgi:hypothetical protein